MQAFLGSGQTSSPTPTPTPTTTPGCNPGTGNVAQGKSATASGSTQTYGAGNAVDGDANSYWESANNAFPQWAQVDLGCAVSLGKVTLKLPLPRPGTPGPRPWRSPAPPTARPSARWRVRLATPSTRPPATR
ncbi:discoidin domain-containing protein [Kitasatospora arboriphila]